MSGKKQKRVETTLLQVRVATELSERLSAEADARLVGRRLLVERALQKFLDELPPLNT